MNDEIEKHLTEIEARASAATEGPWKRHHNNQPGLDVRAGRTLVACVNFTTDDHAAEVLNAMFITHAREDIPWLIEQVRMLQNFIRIRERDTRSNAGDSAFQKYGGLLERLAD